MSTSTSQIIILDVENSVDCPIGKFKGSPHWPMNKIVMLGSRVLFDTGFYARTECASGIIIYPALENTLMLVGHNIKHDLLMLMHADQSPIIDFVNRGGVFWDTQLVEYILSDQTLMYQSLDELADMYGCEKKLDAVKELWDAGVRTEDIDKDLLEEYLKQDIAITHKAFEEQYKQVADRCILPLVRMEMRALFATTLMEYNGMKVDLAKIEAGGKERYRAITEINHTLFEAFTGGVASWVSPEDADYLARCHPHILYGEIFRDMLNFSSNRVVSALLFGGIIEKNISLPEITSTGEFVTYKSGKRAGEIKFKKRLLRLTVPQSVPASVDWQTKIPGVYKVDDEVLTKVKESTSDPEISHFVSGILNMRGLAKEKSTYFDSYMELVFPDGCLHPNISHVGTVTGRNSCSNPNLQNIPRGD